MHFIQIGEWIFESKAQQLVRDDETVQLEPISSELLLCLIKNQGEVVSKDDLITHVWKNRIVSDSAITRVISMLRKHLGDDPVKPTYIRTIQKQGYSLVISAEEVSEQDLAANQLRGARSLNKYLSIQNSIILLLLVGFAFVLLSRDTERITDVKTASNYIITPVISTKGQQSNIVLSHNEKWLLYSHKAKHSKFSNLYIKNLSNGKINRLTEGEYNDIGASFSFDDSEVYFARIVRGKSCKIMRIDLVGFSDHLEEEIVTCNDRLSFNQVTVLPNNQEILFRDFQMPRGFAIYRYHLKNKTYQGVTKQSELPMSERYQSLSPDGNWLVVLQSRNSFTKVMLKNITTQSEEKVLWKDISGVSGGIDSISWSHDSQAIYFKDNSLNRLINIDIHSNKVTPIALDTQLISSLSDQTNSGEIFASYGLRSQIDVIAVDLVDEPQESIQLDSSANDFHALPINESALFFISDRSGFKQFYLRGENGVAMQLSNFTKNTTFSHLDAHPNGESIIGMAGTRLFSFNIAKKLLTWLTEEYKNISSPFYNEQGEIFYLKANKYQNNLYRYIDKNNEELILEDVGIAQWIKNDQDEDELLYQKHNGVVYRHIFATKETIQETYGLPHPGSLTRKWLGTETGIYFLRGGNHQKRGVYFKPYGSMSASSYYSSEPNELSSIYFDKFNQRLLMDKLDNDMLTKVVKIDMDLNNYQR